MHGTQSAPPSYYRDLANKNMLDQPDMPRGRYDEQGASPAPIAHQSSSSMMQGASSCREQGTCWSLSGADTPEAEPAPIEKATPSANSSDIPQLLSNVSVERLRGPYAPTLILHGGSGSITRAKLPPALYTQYRASLLEYLASTRQKLNSGTSALDAACHAVSLMEDDPLFNCGRGSVFTEKGTIEMEASVMVSSVQDKGHGGSASSGAEVPSKRGASVSLVQGTRHPVLLAREVLLAGGDGLGGVGTMHCQLSGPDVEEWGWKEKGLERKGPDWFWTRKRWKEHLRDLGKPGTKGQNISPGHGSLSLDGGTREHHQTADLHALSHTGVIEEVDDFDYPSQGTVGTVCMDSWGNLAVATSTGGLTNKKAGRIGDTPTVGAGFWAESWEDDDEDQWGEPPESSRYPIDRQRSTLTQRLARALDAGFGDFWRDCLPKLSQSADDSRKILPCSEPRTEHLPLIEKEQPHPIRQGLLSYPPPNSLRKTHLPRRRAVALGGTGNGDSFLRTAAVRTSAAMCRFGSRPNRCLTLCEAVTRVAGPGGELQRSAGNRWQKTFEGQGGVIGIELVSNEQEGKVVFDFNCGGMWRAWIDKETGEPRVMVFKGEYQA